MRGVVRVHNELVVALLDEYRCNDINLRQDVVLVLTLNNLVPSSINPGVYEGWITLTGTANSHFQRAEAKHSVIRVCGVRGVTNHVQIVPIGHSCGDLTACVTATLQRNGRLGASSISVTSSNGQ